MPKKEYTEEEIKIRNENLKKGREKLKLINAEKKRKIKLADSMKPELLEEYAVKTEKPKNKRKPKVITKIDEDDDDDDDEDDEENIEPLLKQEIKKQDPIVDKKELLRQKREMLQKLKEEQEFEEENAKLEEEMSQFRKPKLEKSQPETHQNPYDIYFKKNY